MAEDMYMGLNLCEPEVAEEYKIWNQSYRTTSVVAREQGVKGDNTIVVREVNTAEKGGIEVRLIRRVTIAVCNDTRVHTSRVTVPCLEIDPRHRLTSVDIDNLNVK